MAAGNTYTPIATNTLSSTATSVTFSSISGAYTDLVLVCSIKPSDTTGPSVLLRFNGDTTTTYSCTVLYGNGTAASSSRRSATDYFRIFDNGLSTVSTSVITTTITSIMNYANTTTYKTGISRGNTSDKGTEACVSLWRSTSAITSVEVLVAAGGFATGSTFSLYGILAA